MNVVNESIDEKLVKLREYLIGLSYYLGQTKEDVLDSLIKRAESLNLPIEIEQKLIVMIKEHFNCNSH